MGKNAIREDVVQISFDIEEGPLNELVSEINKMKSALTGAVEDGEDGIQDLINITQGAADGMDDLARAARQAGNANVDGLRNSVGDTNRETQRMRTSLTSLIKQAAALAKMKLTAAFERMKAIPRTVFNKITGGIHKMKNGLIALKNMSFKQLVTKLNEIAGKGLLKGVEGAKKLFGALKKIASIGFGKLKAQLTGLIGKMGQLAVASAKAMGKGFINGIKGAGKSVVALGKKAVATTKKMGLGFAALGIAGMKVGMDFDTSMSQVAATMGMSVEGIHDKTSQQYKDFEMLNNAAREQGKATKFSAAQAGDALNYLALAGYDAEKAAGALPTTLTLATAGGMELAETTDMITDSMSALSIEATQKNLTSFGDQMAKTAQKSNTSVKQLGAAILAVGGDAKNLNGATQQLKTAEANTALGILADSGIKGAEGGTKLRNIIKSLTPMKKKAIKIFDDIGVSAYDKITGEMRPLEDTFTDITKALSGKTIEEQTRLLNTMFNATDKKAVSAMMSATATNAEQLGTSFAAAEIPVEKLGMNLDDMIKNFDSTQSQAGYTKKIMKEFGLDAEQAGVMYSGLMSATGKEGNNRWEDLKTKITNSDGAMQDMADTMNDNLKGRLTELGSATEEVGIAFSRNLMEPAKDTVKELSGWMGDLGTAIDKEGFNGLVKGIGKFTENIVGLLAKAAPKAMDSLMKLMGSVLSGFEANKSQISKATIEVLKAFVNGMSDMIPRYFVLGAEILSEFLAGIVENLPELMKQGQEGTQQLITGIMKQIPSIIQSAVIIIMTLAQGLTNQLPQIIQAGCSIVMMLGQGLMQVAPSLITLTVVLINNLLTGIQQNAPQIANGAIDLIIQLCQGLIACAPSLLLAAVDLIYYLGQGIINNLPQIYQMGIDLSGAIFEGIGYAIPKLVKLLWDLLVGLLKTIFNPSTWIELGKKTIGGLGKGLVNGFKSLFGKGKEAAEETKKGFTEGMDGFSFNTEITDNSSNAFSFGQSTASMTAQGYNSEMNQLKVQPLQTDMSNMFQTGQYAAKEVQQGLNSSTIELPTVKAVIEPTVIKNPMHKKADSYALPTSQADELLNTINSIETASVNTQNTVTNSVQGINTAMSSLTTDTGLSEIPQQTQAAMEDMNHSVTYGMENITRIAQTGLNALALQFRQKMAEIKQVVGSTNLYTQGQNVVNGLINGMSSKKAQLIEKAKEMAESIKNATNEALDIHSPSREMKKTGINVVLGTKIGIEETLGTLKDTSKSMGGTVKEEADKKATPQSRYSPKNTRPVLQNTSTSTFSYCPTIEIKVSGSVDRQTEFKLKKLMKEVLKEDREQMGRL